MTRKTKIGTKVAHVTRDSDTISKVKRSKVKDTGTGAYSGGLPHSLFKSVMVCHKTNYTGEFFCVGDPFRADLFYAKLLSVSHH